MVQSLVMTVRRPSSTPGSLGTGDKFKALTGYDMVTPDMPPCRSGDRKVLVGV